MDYPHRTSSPESSPVSTARSASASRSANLQLAVKPPSSRMRCRLARKRTRSSAEGGGIRERYHRPQGRMHGPLRTQRQSTSPLGVRLDLRALSRPNYSGSSCRRHQRCRNCRTLDKGQAARTTPPCRSSTSLGEPPGWPLAGRRNCTGNIASRPGHSLHLSRTHP